MGYLVGDEEILLSELVDVATIAEQEGYSFAESLQLSLQRRQIARVDQTLAALYPNEYAGGAIEADGQFGWVAFKGAVPGAAQALTVDLTVGVELIANKGYSLKELDAAYDVVSAAVANHDDIANASVTLDVRTGTIAAKAEPLRLGMTRVETELLRNELIATNRLGSAVRIDLEVGYGLFEANQKNHIRGWAFNHSRG